MIIEKNKVVTFHYRLHEVEGEILEDSRQGEPMVYLHGLNSLMAGMEQALEGKAPGESVSLTLEPEKTYGLRQEGATRRIPTKHLLTKGKLTPGMIVVINTADGPTEATLLKVGKFNVDIDANHPLAGKTLTFDLEVTDVREATEVEISHGHVHGPGGHHH
jgi:FKBP-type peptidyl-prolyl cis-trans isomerase SlyD